MSVNAGVLRTTKDFKDRSSFNMRRIVVREVFSFFASNLVDFVVVLFSIDF